MTGGVVVMTGPPCSGKSTVARLLTADASAHPSAQPRRILLEVDTLFSMLLPHSDRGRADRMLGYYAAHLLARMLVERGETVVLECTYARREQRASLVSALASLPVIPVRIVEFFVTPADAVRRFRQRDDATDLDDALVRERAEAFPYSDQALRVVSASAAPDEHAHALAEWLAADSPGVDRQEWVGAGRGWD